MDKVLSEKPEVTRMGVLDVQVCVPSAWTDAEVVAFANASYPCGTTGGWQIRREGSPLLRGDKERSTCDSLARKDFVHVMLDA